MNESKEVSELTVILKDAEGTYKQTFVSYEDYIPRKQDEFVKSCIAIALQYFNREPDSVKIKITFEVE